MTFPQSRLAFNSLRIKALNSSLNQIRQKLFFFLLALFVFSGTLHSHSAQAKVRDFRIAAIEIDGTKFWLPSVIVVEKGDTVKIHLENKLKGASNALHGFAIEAYKQETLVESEENKEKNKTSKANPGISSEVEFTASEKGIFPIRCHLHPAHIGGQLVVQ